MLISVGATSDRPYRPLERLIDHSFELGIALAGRRVGEREDLGGPEARDAIPAVDPVIDVRQPHPGELAGGAAGRRGLVVNHEAQPPRLGAPGEEF